jgi:putative endonuclease
VRHARPSRDELGLLGEVLARRWLAHAGLRCVGRRVATRHAEVDLVLVDGDTLVCCEVKTARGTPGLCARPGQRFSARALARHARAARELGAAGRWRRARVDLVEVWLDPRGGARVVVHRDLRRPLFR